MGVAYINVFLFKTGLDRMIVKKKNPERRAQVTHSKTVGGAQVVRYVHVCVSGTQNRLAHPRGQWAGGRYSSTRHVLVCVSGMHFLHEYRVCVLISLGLLVRSSGLSSETNDDCSKCRTLCQRLRRDGSGGVPGGHPSPADPSQDQFRCSRCGSSRTPRGRGAWFPGCTSCARLRRIEGV